MKILRRLKHPTQTLISAVLLIIAIKHGSMILKHGGQPLAHADGMSEALALNAAKIFKTQGILKTWGIPQYVGAEMPILKSDGKSEALKPILEQSLYTHFLPAPDWLIWAASFFSDSDDRTLKLARFALLAVFIFSLAFLYTELNRHPPIQRYPALTSLFILCIGFLPGIRHWAIGISGHSFYTSSCLLGLALGAKAARVGLHRKTQGAVLCVGFFGFFMYMAACFVVAFSTAVGFFAFSRQNNYRTPMILVGTSITGMVLAFTFHKVLIAQAVGFSAMWADIIASLNYRADTFQTSLPKLLWQYHLDSVSFWGIPAGITAIIYGLLQFQRSKTYADFKNPFLAGLIAILSAYAWIILMKGHAEAHRHVLGRFFMLPVFLLGIGLVQVISQKLIDYQENDS